MRFLNLATEEQSVDPEDEVTIYAKISNPDGLEQAYKVEHHIQASIKTDNGTIRVRHTQPLRLNGNEGGEETYVQTTKKYTRSDGVKSSIEKNIPITKEQFDQFLEICEDYMSKTRYVFRVENLVIGGEGGASIEAKDLNFEVDVFEKKDKTVSVWCKIDVEVQGLVKQLQEAGLKIDQVNLKIRIGHLPFAPVDFVLDDKDGNKDKKELIKELYKSEFLIENN